MTLDQLAGFVHNAGRAVYSAFNLEPHQEWTALDEDNRMRFAKIVAAAGKEKALSAKRWHELWMEKMREENWVMGPSIDYETKQHPALTNYEDLANRSVVERARLNVQAAILILGRNLVTKEKKES